MNINVQNTKDNQDNYIDNIGGDSSVSYIEVKKGKSRKTGTEYEYVEVSIGDWSGRIYPRTQFELNYIKKQLGY